MMDMTGLIIDFYDDSFASVLADDQDAMEKVGSVEPLPGEELDKIEDHEFALILCDGPVKFRKFACHEPGHVKLSMHYYSRNRHKLHPQAQKTAAFFLKRAYLKHGMKIPDELEKYANGFKAPTNVVSVRDSFRPPEQPVSKPDLGALSDDEFAYIKKEGAYKVRKYPMRKKAHLVASIRFFVDHQDDHKPGERVKIARNMIKMAQQMKIATDDPVIANLYVDLEKLAENSFAPDLHAWITVRKSIVESEESQATLDELYEKRAEFGDATFAALLSKFDEIEGLDRYYEKGLPNPDNTTFGIEKKAAQIQYMNGERQVGVGLIESIEQSTIEDVFGKEAGEKWASDPVGTFEAFSDAAKDLVVEQFVKAL